MPLLKSKKVHFLGEIRPARIQITEKQPLKILDYEGSSDWNFADAHIAPAIADPHVHFRESYRPSLAEWEEFWQRKLITTDYKTTLQKIDVEKQNYSVKNGILAALKSGVWLVGAMSNTSFPAITKKIWEKTIQQYQNQKLGELCNPVYFHLWHYGHPEVEKIEGQCVKDFGSTFGAAGFSKEQREKLYQKHKNSDLRFHNDRARAESITDFLKSQKTNPEALLHDFYYCAELVLQEQQEIYNLAKKHQLASLITLHIPTGSAFKQMLDFQKQKELNIELEVGLDYLVNNQEQKQKSSSRWINYRRPAHPSFEEQKFLIEQLKKNTNNKKIWIGSDHAPHTKAAKKWQGKLPAAPGTRCLEFFGAILQKLVDQWGYSYEQIDRLASYHPQEHLQKYRAKYAPFPYKIGAIQTGNMANLRIFDPKLPAKTSSQKLAIWLEDQEYHSSLCNRTDLKSQNLMTIINGICFDTREKPKRIIS